MKNVLVVHRERDGFRHKQTQWKDYALHFVDFCLHDMFKVKDSGKIQGVLSREKLENAARAAADNGCDAVFSESAEAFLLQFVLLKKSIKTPPFIITDLNRLVKARALCRWIASVYGEDPFEKIVSSASNYWFCYTQSELSEHEALGIARERLFYVPCSLYFLDETFIAEKGSAKKFARPPEAGPPSAENPLGEAMRGQIIAFGNNYRDYETLVRAAEGLPFDVHIISSRFFKSMPARVPESVRVHDDVPLDALYRVLSAAKFLVIPLCETYLSPGTAAAGLAIGFGKPVVASDFPCLRDYVINGETGMLSKPGDADALRKNILELYGDASMQRRMSESAKILSDRLDALAEENLAEIFRAAVRSGTRYTHPAGFTAETQKAQRA